jgi:hypothetical protein
MPTVYPYDTQRSMANGSYKYLYKVTPDKEKTNYPNAGIIITQPMDEVIVTITNTIKNNYDYRSRMVIEIRYRNKLVSFGLSLPIIGGWYVRIVDQSDPIYTNLNDVINGTYDFMAHEKNEGDVIIVYSEWCPSTAYNIIANPTILQSDPNNGFDFFQDTVESQLRFIDKCVAKLVVYYDNKPANQCINNNGDVLIIDTDINFFETEKRILELPEFLSKYAKVVMLVIYLLVFMINLNIFDEKYQKGESDIKYYQQFKYYIKSNRIPYITSELIIDTIDYLHQNNIDNAFRMIKNYLSKHFNMCYRDELDTTAGLKKWLLHVFNLSAPVKTFSKSAMLSCKHTISTETQKSKRISNAIDSRKENRQHALFKNRNINANDDTIANDDTKWLFDINWLFDTWRKWYMPKESLSSVFHIVNRGAGSRRPRKMNSRKKHLNKRTHKSINARTSKSNPK